MVAPVVIAAGIAARYGAKKLMKHLTKQTLKKSKGKDAINKAQKTKKNIETRNNMDVEKASWKKVYRGAREMDGSYTDPANAILRAKGKVNIGSRPIGKNANKVKNTNKSPMSSLTGKVQKQQGNRPYSIKNPAYKNPTKRINSKDMQKAFDYASKNNLFKNAIKNKKRDGFVAGEKAARKYVKEMDTRVKKAGLKKLAKKGYSLKDLEF